MVRGARRPVKPPLPGVPLEVSACVGSRVAVAVTAVRLLIGFAVGLTAGLLGSWIDEILMRFVDFLLAFPGIVLALVISGILGRSLTNALIALAVVGWGSYVRVVRGSVLSVREEPFVDAARFAGVSRVRLIVTHLVPNVAGPVVVLATLDLGGVLLAAAALSSSASAPSHRHPNGERCSRPARTISEQHRGSSMPPAS